MTSHVTDTNVGKMTPQESAIRRLQYLKKFEDKELFISDLMVGACDMAIEALQKQIPTKLTHEAMPWGLPNYRIETCPFCKNSQDTEYPHCRYCGQALDWGDE